MLRDGPGLKGVGGIPVVRLGVRCPETGTPAPPTAPSNLTATANGTAVDLAWTDNSIDETGFKVERAPDGVTFAQIDTVGAGVAVYTDPDLTPGTYTYRVRAYNGVGDSTYSNTDNATIAAGLLWAETFEGELVTPATSVTEMIAYGSNPVIDSTTVAGAGMGNPKEPDCIKIGTTYYMVVALWSTYAVPAMANRKVVLLKSTDLIAWTYVQTLKDAAHCPTIFEWNGAYHVLYGYNPSGTDAIGWMHTTDPEGAWTDEGTILEDGTRDPYVYVEGGTVYLFTTFTAVQYRTTTETDFSDWSGATTALSLPAGMYMHEGHSIVKVGSTYYLMIAEVPDDTSTSLAHNAVVYTANAITGPWTKSCYAFLKGAAVSWHDESHGHYSFIRSGDIETNPGPLAVSGQYPVFNEGGDGTEWRIGLFYGEQVRDRPTFTIQTARTIADIDVVHHRFWIEKYEADAGDTPFVTFGYTLPDGATLWRVEMPLTLGRWENNAAPGMGFGAWYDASNWWFVRLNPKGDNITVAKFAGGGYSLLATLAVTVDFQVEYDLTVEKLASNQIEVSLDGASLGTVTDAFFGSLDFALAVHTFFQSGDVDGIEVYG